MDESICGTARKIRKKNKTNKKREKQPNVFLHPVDDRMPKKGNPITKNRSWGMLPLLAIVSHLEALTDRSGGQSQWYKNWGLRKMLGGF